MRELTKLQSILYAVGALLMVIGVGCTVFAIVPKVTTIAFATGAVLFVAMQLQQVYLGTNFVIRRLRRIMLIADICFILAALLMMEDAYLVIYQYMASTIEGYNTYIHYFHNNWVVALLIAAILEMYTTHRISYELRKEDRLEVEG